MRLPIAKVARLAIVGVLLIALTGCLRGPITGGAGIALTTGFDVAEVGYTRSEFFVSGFARTFSPAAPLTNDGKWTVTAEPVADDGVFVTRIVVIRPADPSRFNGTVIVEWLNVSAGGDLATDYLMAHNEMLREGAVWIGVSAQAQGVDNLRSTDAARYGSLHHPGDSYSYDMFSFIGRSIRANFAKLTDGLVPQRMLATGESQSAGRLVTYLNAVHPSAGVYDGFLVHSRSGGGAPLSQSPVLVPVASPMQIRNDLDAPVFVVQAEGDVINSNLGARQPDTTMFRSWELAGTSHADAYTVAVGFNDRGDGSGAVQMFNFMRAPLALGCGLPINAGSHHWQLQAAFHHLDAWVRTGTLPPIGPLLDVESSSPVVLARDAFGNALGGVRSPQVDARVARLDGANTGAGFCRLFGSTTPLTPQQLLALYPTHADFVSQWDRSLLTTVAGGFILAADANELHAAAQQSQIPN
ncbi:MAG: alpha/beta hydrolase domain-containing protein [Acidimicrobiia bacterium]